MPICGLCGEAVKTVYKCKECGVLFCDECGYPKEGICDLCEEEDEYVEEDRERTDVI